MTSTMTHPSVDAYLDAVRACLSDLPGPDCDDVIAEIAASVVEAAAEGSIEDRLGPARVFAAELRSAAGLAPPRDRESFDVRAALRAITERLRVAREFAPIWWVLRGFVVVSAIGFATGWVPSHTSIPRLGDSETGAIAVGVGVVASVLIGLGISRMRPALRRSVWIVDLVAVVLLLPVAIHAAQSHPVVQTYVTGPTVLEPVVGLAYNGVPVKNIYPYSRDGKLMHDVLLYDEQGRPISLNAGDPDPNRRVLHTLGKYVPIFNSFPIRYFDRGTTHVTHPNAGPRVHVARLAPGP